MDKKSTGRNLSIFGGAGESRTRVRKPLDTTFSGCRLSIIFPAKLSDSQDSLVGILLVHDRYKEKISVHVRCCGYAPNEAAALITGTGRIVGGGSLCSYESAIISV